VAEFDARGDLVGEPGAGDRWLGRDVRQVLDQRLIRGQRGRLQFVRCLGRGVREDLGTGGAVTVIVPNLEETDGRLALDHDVRAPVRESLEDLRDPRSTSDLAHTVLVDEDDRERLVLIEAAGRHLLVARFEDVQRQEFAGDEDQLKREEGEVVDHGAPKRRAKRVSTAVARTASLPFPLMSALPPDPEDLAALVRAGDRRAVARAVSWIENADADAPPLVAALWPHTGRARMIGITGPPGAGKSTLIGALARAWRARGETVGIVAVDPSSPFSSGAVLGDRVRMVDLDVDPGVFFRSMGSRGRLGGIAQATYLAAAVLDAAGFDIVIVETVGAGQSDIRIADLVDVVVLALQPGSGDSVQAIKAGVMEIPDVVCMTKADAADASAFFGELRLALSTDPERAPELVAVSARDATGIDDLREAIERRRDALGEAGRIDRRRAGLERELVAGAAGRAADRAQRMLTEDPTLRAALGDLHDGTGDPLRVAALLDERLRGGA
jgi:LAO/AO transport system kinase